jgi:hypothetical protein
MTRLRPYHYARLTTALVCCAVVGASVARAGQAHAAAIAPAPAAAASAWSKLSAAQRETLKPLAEQWSSMDDNGREKWINVAARYPQLSAAEQKRMQERMTQWAHLQPSERGEARLRFQQTRKLSPIERQEKWAEYQALPSTDRADLTRQGERKSKVVFLPDNLAGPREAAQIFASKQRQASGTSATKSNVVPNALTATGPTPTSVAPALIKAGSGATTTLVTQAANPPLHQHTGLTKITTSKSFVDPVTLLPRKGAQSAAMASLPSNSQGYGD